MRRSARTTLSSSVAAADLRLTPSDERLPKAGESSDAGPTGTSMLAASEKRPRHRMTDLQLQHLENLFAESTHPSRETKQALGKELGL